MSDFKAKMQRFDFRWWGSASNRDGGAIAALPDP